MGLCISRRLFIAFLADNGFCFVRQKATSHRVYGNGAVNVPIPVHGFKEFGEEFINQVLRETGLSKRALLSYLGRS